MSNLDNIQSYRNAAPSMTLIGGDRRKSNVANSFINIQEISGGDGVYEATLRPLSSSGIFYARSMNALYPASAKSTFFSSCSLVTAPMDIRRGSVRRDIIIKPPSLIFDLIENQDQNHVEVEEFGEISRCRQPDPMLVLFLFGMIPCTLIMALPFNFAPRYARC